MPLCPVLAESSSTHHPRLFGKEALKWDSEHLTRGSRIPSHWPWALMTWWRFIPLACFSHFDPNFARFSPYDSQNATVALSLPLPPLPPPVFLPPLSPLSLSGKNFFGIIKKRTQNHCVLFLIFDALGSPWTSYYLIILQLHFTSGSRKLATFFFPI